MRRTPLHSPLNSVKNEDLTPMSLHNGVQKFK